MPRVLKTGDVITFGVPIERGSDKFIPHEVRAKLTWEGSTYVSYCRMLPLFSNREADRVHLSDDRYQDKPVTYRVPDDSDVEDDYEIENEDEDGDEMSYSKDILEQNNFRPARTSEFTVELISNPEASTGSSDAGNSFRSMRIVDLTSDEMTATTATTVDTAEIAETSCSEPPEEEPATKRTSKTEETPVPGAYMDYSDDDADDDFDPTSQSPHKEPASDDSLMTDDSDSSSSSDAGSEDDSEALFAYENGPFTVEVEDQIVECDELPEFDDFSSHMGPISEFGNPWVSSAPSSPAAADDQPAEETSGEHTDSRLESEPPLHTTSNTMPSLPSFKEGFEKVVAPRQAPMSSTAEVLGPMTGKTEFFSARDQNRRNLGIPNPPQLRIADFLTQDQAQAQPIVPSNGFVMGREELRQVPVAPSAEVQASRDLLIQAAKAEAEKMLVESRAKSQPAEPMRMETKPAPATVAPSAVATKRKADEISESTREEQAKLVASQTAMDLRQDSSEAPAAPLASAPAAVTASQPPQSADQVSKSSTPDVPPPAKRFRRAAEVIGYAAIGGVAVMSALIATAPAL